MAVVRFPVLSGKGSNRIARDAYSQALKRETGKGPAKSGQSLHFK